MRITNANAQLIKLDDISKKIEQCGRICYRSENKKQDNETCQKFIHTLIKNKHTAMLEHAHIYIKLSAKFAKWIKCYIRDVQSTDCQIDTVTRYFNITVNTSSPITAPKPNDTVYISGSVRSFLDVMEIYFKNHHANLYMNALYAELSNSYPRIFIPRESIIPDEHNACKKEIHLFANADEFIIDMKNNISDRLSQNLNEFVSKHIIHSIQFTCDRGVSHELVRHRPASFAQESTRYCDYSHDKFNNEITVIRPCFWNENSNEYKYWKQACEFAETAYFNLLKAGALPQQARSVLPTSLKTEVIMTATETEWQHIINLRQKGTTGAPHPQMKEIMDIALPLLTSASDGRIV